jgi:hypothetical protein
MKETEKKEVNKKAMVQVQVQVQAKVKVEAAMVQVRWTNMGKSMPRVYAQPIRFPIRANK